MSMCSRSSLNVPWMVPRFGLCLGLCVGLLWLAPALPGTARAEAPAVGAVSPDEILRRADKASGAFQDAYFHFKMLIKEPSGQTREIEFSTTQKGPKRMVRFLAPGDIKGMGVLVENANTMYALLPAFGNRVRRIGSSQANQSFMGSDVSSEEMSSVEFSSQWQAKLVGPEGESLVLELSPRPGLKPEFPKMKLWVDAKTYAITKIESYDATGKKMRTQTRGEFRADPGAPFASPHRLVFIDHRRNDHTTEMILLDSKFNAGVPDDAFSVRALQKG